MLRSAGSTLRTTKGSAIKLWAMGMSSGKSGEFQGGVLNTMMKPKPNVTAEAPRGSMNRGSIQRLMAARCLRA